MLINEKIEDLQNLIKRRITYEEVAAILGLGSGSALRNWIYRKRPLKAFEIKKIDEAFGVDKIKTTQSTSDNYIEIPVRGEVTASLGTGVEVYNEDNTSTYQLGEKLLKDIGASRQFSEIIFAQGDSMEPTIEGGDSLLVDLSKKEVYDGKIYCVRVENKLYAKRLQLIPPHKIKVISDNKEKYDPFYIDISKDVGFDFAVIGEVKWWGRVAK